MACETVQIQRDKIELRRRREWGTCWLGLYLWYLLGEDYSLAQKDKPYRCLDLLLKHSDELFQYLKGQWGNLFGGQYDDLLYDLTSTYFENDQPPPKVYATGQTGL